MPTSTKVAVIGLFGMLLAASPAPAQFGAPLLEAVDSGVAGRHVNVFVQLRCSARYLGHAPRETGTQVTVRLRLGADCGADAADLRAEHAASTGASEFVRAVRLEPGAAWEAALTIEWSDSHRFLVLPTSDARGVRLRILDVLPPARAAVKVAPVDESSGYSVNLVSSKTPFTPEDLEAAARVLETPVHVSAVELAGEIWQRLRAGPISSRSDAQRLLAVARQHYPRAWLAVADETTADGIAEVPRELTPRSVLDPPLPAEERDRLLAEARRALSRRDSRRAAELLTKLIRQPEYPGRARAQEMLGLARERAGQVAHAKAEYEEYLRRYPQGDAAARVRSRLRALNNARRVGPDGLIIAGTGPEHRWRIDGGASQLYRWERSELTTTGEAITRQEQNALYTDSDLVARRRGERFDVVSRFSAGYAHDLLADGPGNQTRLSSAFVELNDRDLGWATRVGRQSRNSGGLLGTFDGIHATYPLRPTLAVNFATGFPVESTREAPDTARRFVGLSADFGPFAERFDFGAFAVWQQIAGVTDRQAVGLEARYFVPGRTLLAMVDYDLHYRELNGAVITGSVQLPARWSLSFSADHRASPVLTTRNALSGQPVQALDELLGLFTREEIEQLARDRTPLSDFFSLSISRPVGERFHVDFEAYASRLAETEASANVAATPASGLERTFQMQMSGNSLAGANDLWVLTLRRHDGALAAVDSLGLAARLPMGPAWRFGPRLRLERRETVLGDVSETLYVPTLRLDYLRNRAWFECEAGAEFGSRKLAIGEETRDRFFLGLGYRVTF